MNAIKKVLTIFLSLIILVSTFVGCGNSTKEDENTIVVWVSSLENEREKLNEYAQEWAKDNNVNVILKINDGSDGKSLADTNEFLRPDIFWGIDAEDTELLAKSDTIVKVPDNLISSDSYVSDDLIRGTSNGGIQYGIPVTQEFVILYYNKDLVNTVPKTMEELVEVAKDKGMAFELSNYYYSYGFVASQGGYIFKDNNGKYDVKDIGINNEGAKEGYTLLNKLFVDNNLFVGGMSDMAAAGNFSAGKVAFYIGEPGRVRTFTNDKVNFGTAVIPTLNGKTVTPLKYIKMAVVSKVSKKQEQSWSLIKYLSERCDDVYMEMGPAAPIYKKSLESSIYNENENLKNLYSQSLQTTLLPNNIENGAFDYSLPLGFTGLATGELSGEECGDKIEVELNKVLKDLFTY